MLKYAFKMYNHRSQSEVVEDRRSATDADARARYYGCIRRASNRIAMPRARDETRDASDASSSCASEGETVRAVVAAERCADAIYALDGAARDEGEDGGDATTRRDGAGRARARARRARVAKTCETIAREARRDRTYAAEATRARVGEAARRALETFGDDDDARRACEDAARACEDAAATNGERVRTRAFGGVEVRVLETEIGNGVGAKLWNAAVTLSERLARTPEIVRGKRVLEVGAGVGMCGILCAKLGAAFVTLSDFEDALLDALDRSVADNGVGDACVARAVDWTKEAERLPTPAANPRHVMPDDAAFDVIIGSDVPVRASTRRRASSVRRSSTRARRRPAGSSTRLATPTCSAISWPRSTRAGSTSTSSRTI